MAETYLSTDPNAELQDQSEYLSTDPNAGLEQQGPSGLEKGLQTVQQGLGLAQKLYMGGIMGQYKLTQPAAVTEFEEKPLISPENIKSLTGIALGKNFVNDIVGETLAGFTTPENLALLAVPGLVKGRIPTLRETDLGEKPAAPEVMPQTPEPLAAETVPPITETIPTEEITNAVQEQSTSSVLPHPQEGVTETGGERVGVGPSVQGEAPAQARPQTQEVAPSVPQPEQPFKPVELRSPTEPTGTSIEGEPIYAPEMHAVIWKEPDGMYRLSYGDEHAVRQHQDFDTLQEAVDSAKSYGITEPDKGWFQKMAETEGIPELAKKPSPVPKAEGATTAATEPKTEVPTETTTAQPLPQTPSEPPPVTPETPEAPEVPKTGVSSERFVEQYGEDAPIPNTGRSAGELKALGQTRLDNFQKTGAVQDDPYSVLTNLREGKVPVSRLADDVSLLRAEHQRLKNDAIASEGTPEWEAKSQASLDMAQAIKEVAHGPASDMMRSFQEYDAPRYDNVTDFDQALRERLGRESTSQERVKFKEMADDVTNTRNGAQEAINGAQKKLGKMPKMNFEDAYKSIHDQIAELTKDCVL